MAPATTTYMYIAMAVALCCIAPASVAARVLPAAAKSTLPPVLGVRADARVFDEECLDKKAALAAVEECEETRGAWGYTCSDTGLSHRGCGAGEVLDQATGACTPRCAEKENPLPEGAALASDFGWGDKVGAAPSKDAAGEGKAPLGKAR